MPPLVSKNAAVTVDGKTGPVHLAYLQEVGTQQREDKYMASMIEYLTMGTLLGDDKTARHIVMENRQFQVMDNVLHFENQTVYCGS